MGPFETKALDNVEVSCSSCHNQVSSWLLLNYAWDLGCHASGDLYAQNFSGNIYNFAQLPEAILKALYVCMQACAYMCIRMCMCKCVWVDIKIHGLLQTYPVGWLVDWFGHRPLVFVGCIAIHSVGAMQESLIQRVSQNYYNFKAPILEK